MRYITLVRLYADNPNNEYLTNRVYVINSNEGLGGSGALKYSSAMADSKKATDKQH